MKKTTKGAWLINHTKKLFDVKETGDFEDIEEAGKCGIFLSNLAASDEQSDINPKLVDTIAKVSGLKRTEVDAIKRKLADAHLIDISSEGAVSVLGVTTSSVLGHTTDIFNDSNPSQYQKAALDLAENISDQPKGEKLLKDYISDTYKLSKNDTTELFTQSEEIGFVDYEALDDKSKLYFNGNLFRRGTAAKTNAVLNSLKPEDKKNIVELDDLLEKTGCTSRESAKKILGEPLLSKLQSIGMYDFNEVNNSSGTTVMLTKPGAFSKYGNPFEEDALDLAKAFVSSLYYGMNFSRSSRGKITMLKALMQRLVDGYEVGPATAIGEDYNLLAYKRVIKIRPEEGTSKFWMRLLKKDVGELAMQVLEFGDATEKLIQGTSMSFGAIIKYSGPEEQRTITRKAQNQPSKRSVLESLRQFRS